MPLLRRKDREVVGTASAIFAFLALMLAFFAFAFAAHADNKKTGVPAGTVQVTLTEFAISPSSISAPTNGKLLVTNSGSAVHNFHVEGTDVATKDIAPGGSATVDLKGVKAGSYTVFCAVSGHRQAGMQAQLIIGSGSSGSTGSAGTHDMSSMDFNTMTPEQMQAMNAQMDKNMANAVDTYVAQLKNGANTKGVGNQPLAPKVLADGTKEFHL